MEQREKECMDAITALSEQEKAGDNIDAQTERLRQDAEHTIQQRRRSNQSEETWDATIAAKLAAGLEPWTPRSDGILDFLALYVYLVVRVKWLDDRLIGRRERLDDDKDLMLKALGKLEVRTRVPRRCSRLRATWLHPGRLRWTVALRSWVRHVEVLSLFASKLARFAKELFRLEHRCDAARRRVGETDSCGRLPVASGGTAGLRVNLGWRGLPGGGLRTSGFDRRRWLLARGSRHQGETTCWSGRRSARYRAGPCGERTDGWFAAKSTPGSLLRTPRACRAPRRADGSAILQPAQ